MRTGDQWKNTVYTDEGGTAHVGTTSGGTRQMPSSEVEQSMGTEGISSRSLQGLMFHPATGTGRKDDPTVSPEQRRSAILDAYSLHPDQFANTYEVATGLSVSSDKNIIPSARTRPETAAEYREAAIDSIDRSDVTTHEMAKTPQPRVVAFQRNQGVIDSNTRGFYSPSRFPSEGGVSHIALDNGKAPMDVTMHEIGHGRHLQGYSGKDPLDASWVATGSKRDSADPLYEGVAEGYEAHFTSDKHVDELSNADHWRSITSLEQGYGSRYRGWANNDERALYAAAHLAVSRDPSITDDLMSYRTKTYESIKGETPSTDVLMGDVDDKTLERKIFGRSNQMAVGRLMHERPEVREFFDPKNIESAEGAQSHAKKIVEAANTAHERYQEGLERNKPKMRGERELPF